MHTAHIGPVATPPGGRPGLADLPACGAAVGEILFADWLAGCKQMPTS